ncbi:hypothetical protein HPB48_021829 [Haemaphysalis longicornis]|uniref:G2/mitotic-specific cyclin-B3 n=1 Tax=Haemaphysalis longicornis TaxID=44386 RepID=A0A9J6FV38_HAELO|nr:hypothetical protein HPB48_021829 [Haemaphysalis longicornis]
MTGRDAGERFFNDDDNHRTVNKISEQPENSEEFAQDAVPNRKALRDTPSNTAPHPSPRRHWPTSINWKTLLTTLRQGNAKANAHDGPGTASTQCATCKEDDTSIISTGGPENGTAAAPIHSLPDFQKAEGEPSGVLNAAIRTFDMMSYTGIREKETNELYWQDVYNNLRDREQELLPDALYMHRQPHTASYWRSDLVDWLVTLAEECSLYDEKLFLAVSYIDRFLSLMSVQRNCLQLLGTAVLFTASKFGEGDQPRCSDLLCAGGNIYAKDDMLGMEREMFQVLIYGICVPTVYYYLRRAMEVSKAPAGLGLLAQYFCELALLDDDPYLQFPPSVIAGAAVCLVHPTFGRQPWGRETAEYSGYEVAYFKEGLPCFHTSASNAPSRSQKAVRNKLKTTNCLYVAGL